MIRAVVAFSLAVGSLAVLVPQGRAADQKAIQEAIDRGVAYLRSLQRRDGTWPHHTTTGMTALAGLTLLECGVPADDPAVQQAAQAVRDDGGGVTATYSLSLAILFLDLLGDPRDEPLIQTMAIRLMAGQNQHGGWTYFCPEIDETDVRQIRSLIKQKRQLVGRDQPAKRDTAGKSAPDVDKEIQKAVARLMARRRPAPFMGFIDDNSNTQFATLGTWVARRHGVPADQAAAQLNTRFRQSQNGDGGWGYHSGATRDFSTATMTCAGLLGLAVAFGVSNEHLLRTEKGGDSGHGGRALRDPASDPAIKKGLVALSTAIGRPIGGRPGRHQVLRVGPGGRAYYFLWSLERVAVAYGLETIGKKDWYAWGAEVLLANQEDDGSWVGAYAHGGADTCFALLFLRRANLAKDLTASLNGKVKDPGDAVLRAGGVGGDSVKGDRPPLNANDKIAGEEPRPEGGRAARTPERPVVPARTEPQPAPGPSASRPVEPPVRGSDAASAETDRLRRELLGAPAAVQDVVILRFRDASGPAYTQALADAIPKLGPTRQKKAREALAERLTRMTADTLGAKLRDESIEIRRAAALATAMKEDKGHLPRLIELLEDPDPAVARAAHVALKSLTGEDLGPAAHAAPEARARAAAEWKAWLKKQTGR